ncbi:B3 domain-containing protein [Salix suchowensis]|nr:B3 domain-containing protein [Salix suchowensis]
MERSRVAFNLRRMRTSRGVLTELSLSHYDPFTIKKKMKPSDLGNLCRLLVPSNLVEKHILPFLNTAQANQVAGVVSQEANQGLKVRVWDMNTGSMHQLVFKRWSTSRSYIFNYGWLWLGVFFGCGCGRTVLACCFCGDRVVVASVLFCSGKHGWNHESRNKESAEEMERSRVAFNLRRMRTSRGVLTELSLSHYDPFTIKKKMKPSDLGNLCRLLVPSNLVEKHILPFLNTAQANQVAGVVSQEANQGLKVRVWDMNTGSMHQLVFKRWSTSRSYIFNYGWLWLGVFFGCGCGRTVLACCFCGDRVVVALVLFCSGVILGCGWVC